MNDTLAACAAAAFLASLALPLGGCAFRRVATEAPAERAQQVSAASFVERAPRNSAATKASEASTSGPAQARNASGTGPPNPGISRDASATLGPPAPAQTDPADSIPVPTSGSRIIVDTMVGQINGQPVYAETFLEPLDARLRAEARRLSETGTRDWPQRWIRLASELIADQLRDQVRDELMLADFERGVGEREREGIIRFIDNVRSNLLAGNLGSEELTNQRLLESEGLTLDEKVQELSEQELIREQLNRTVRNKTHITWRDIRTFYEANPQFFNPPATARLRVIQVPDRDTEAIDAVNAGIAEGRDFAELAAEHSLFRGEEDNVMTAELETGDLRDVRFFAPDELNDLATSLAEGQVAGPAAFANSQWWFRLDQLDHSGQIELYIAQLQIAAQLQADANRAAEARYFAELLERANVSDFDTMIRELLEYAASKYLTGLVREPPR